jgi:hypothetical protein
VSHSSQVLENYVGICLDSRGERTVNVEIVAHLSHIVVVVKYQPVSASRNLERGQFF